MKKVKVFVDSDVIISSLISSKGAAYLLLNETDIEPSISTISQRELEVVVGRLGMDESELNMLITKRCSIVRMRESVHAIKENFQAYTSDENDAHIVAGAKRAKVPFLVTYNVRHFNVERIKKDLDILVVRPAQLLQYLRSRA